MQFIKLQILVGMAELMVGTVSTVAGLSPYYTVLLRSRDALNYIMELSIGVFDPLPVM